MANHAFIEVEQKCIPLQHQPACLIDMALARDVDSHRLLRGTGLFYEQLNQHPQITPQQYLRLFSNALNCLNANDSSFQFGQRLLPGHTGAISTALAHAPHFADAFDNLRQHRLLLSPILSPRLQLDQDYIYIYWLDVMGVAELRTQWVETMMSALVAMTQWQSGERWPWRFLFSHERPAYLEQYHAYLGSDLHFNCHVDALILPRQYWLKPWPRASQTVAQLAKKQIEMAPGALPNNSFVELVYQLLFEQLQRPYTLEAVAAQLGISAATCKRKLSAHGYSFQRLHDEVRKHVALYLYWARDYGSDAVASYLGFHDTTNFRRSFKRWTGMLPSVLRQQLPQS